MKISLSIASVLIGLMAFSSLPLYAQYVSDIDSLQVVPAPVEKAVIRPSQWIVPSAIILSGVSIHYFAHKAVDSGVNDQFVRWLGENPLLHFDDVVQYVPIAASLSLGFFGVPSNHDFMDRVLISAGAYLSAGIISRAMKEAINSPRPNLFDNKSFPSGHTCMAFTGAELVRMEYGWGWGAGAYAIASGVAFMRMYNRYHWFSDILAGAGVGILCAHVGEWLLCPVKNLFGISDKRRSVAFSPTIDPLSGAMCSTLSLSF